MRPAPIVVPPAELRAALIAAGLIVPGAVETHGPDLTGRPCLAIDDVGRAVAAREIAARRGAR